MPTAKPTGPTQEHAFENGPKIIAIETVIPRDVMPGLLALRIHTDGSVDGRPVLGHGETYYVPEAAAAVIHDWMAHRLLGADATAVESHWRFLYERAIAFGGYGAELRALSAVDLALWDVLGQVTEQPVWKLLGGPVRSCVPVYNSCGGPTYGGARPDAEAPPSWPGHGDIGEDGPLEDNWKSVHAPGDLAEELWDAGYRAMKLWSFDRVYREAGGQRISAGHIQRGVAPFQAIRERMGDRMDLMLDGHGFFSLAAGLQIARAVREFQPLWLEDIVRPDSLDTIAQFRREAGAPVAVSEMLVLRSHYQRVLDQQGADFVMIDPTWVGGISESKRIAELAQLYNVPVLMHDCTGPFTLFAGLHVAMSVASVTYQETVRAHLATVYPRLIDFTVDVKEGAVAPPKGPGMGIRWRENLFQAGTRQHRVTRL